MIKKGGRTSRWVELIGGGWSRVKNEEEDIRM